MVRKSVHLAEALQYRPPIVICGTRNKDEKKGEKLSSLMSWANGYTTQPKETFG